MMINDEYILNKYWKGKTSNFARLDKNNKVLICERYWLEHRYLDSSSISETLYRMKNNLEERPVCPICGNPVKWDKYLKFSEYCSKTCANRNPSLISTRNKTLIDRYGVDSPSKIPGFDHKAKQVKLEKYGDPNYNNKEKRKETNLEKYGTTTPFLNKDIQEKINQIKLERYGDVNYNNPSKTKQTKLERYGNEKYVNIDKIKQTCLEKYGVEYTFQSDQVKEKSMVTSLIKYGTFFPMQSQCVLEKVKNTCLKKYGIPYAVQLPSAKENSIKTSMKKYGVPYSFMYPEFRKDAAAMVTEDSILKRICTSINRFGTDNFNNRSKAKETCLKRYGVNSYSKTDKWKENMSGIMSSENMQKRRHNTMQENKTFATSKPEESLYAYIKEKFPQVVRQYRDKERYPYNCDFYIPELDLFLELQGSWTHGKHAYNPDNVEDQDILQEWKSRNTKYYNNAIKTWTIRDVKKRETARENNLNFKEVWNLEDGISYIDELCAR